MSKFKFSWGHGIFLALLSFICFILYLIFIFPIGQQNSELVSDNYYEDEVLFQNVIDAKRNAEELTAIPQYHQNNEGIKITFPERFDNTNTKVKFNLYRTDDKRLDVKKDISLDANNSFFIPKSVLVTGGYTLKLQWTSQNKNYQVDYDLVWN